MSKKALYLLGIILTILLGCLLLYFTCCKNCANNLKEVTEEKEVIIEKEIPEVTNIAFNIEDNSSGLKFSANDNFKFYTSNFTIIDSVSSTLNNQLERLTGYLNNNANKNVTIKGLYTENEKNTSVFPNLGFARANSVKNYFVSHGISPKSLKLKGEQVDNLVADEANILYGPVKFDIDKVENNNVSKADVTALKANINKDPLVLYFDTGATSLSLNNGQRQKVVSLMQFVEKYDGEILVTGHTDNTGERIANVALGLKRANFVKDRLISNGINSRYIKASYKGPDMPIASNEDDVGKSKNRRVEVTIN